MDLQVSDLLSLPNDTLLRDILPKIPLSKLTEICVLHPRINQLCQTQELWQNRTALEFFNEYNNKPLDITWRDYYFSLTGGGLIPVYLDNVQIDSIEFVPQYFELTMRRLLPKLQNMRQPYYIILTDKQNLPYITIRQPDNIITVLSDNYRNVEKVIIKQS